MYYLIRPIAITDAALQAHSLPEADHPEWLAATSYSLGQRVMRANTHRVYENLTAGASASLPEATPSRWLDLGPTNRWAAFDRAVGTATTATGQLSFTLAPGNRFDSLALLDVLATSATVTVTSGGSVIFTRTTQLTRSVEPIVDYLSYWQAEFMSTKTLLINDIAPFYANALITITLTGAAISLGTCVVGRQFVVGETRRGLSAGISDYSRKEVDQFGVADFQEGAFSKRLEAAVLCPNSRVDAVFDMLTSYRATPIVCVAARGYSSTVTYGMPKTWGTVFEYAQDSLINLYIEGLT